MKQAIYSPSTFRKYLHQALHEPDISIKNNKLNSIREWLDWHKKHASIGKHEYDMSINELNASRMDYQDNFIARYFSYSVIWWIILFIFLLFIISIFITHKQLFNNQNSYEEDIKTSALTISFKGVLKNSEGLPVSDKSDVYFRLYSDQTTDTPLYVGECVGEQAITPEYDGSFIIVLGSDCNMSPLTQDIFDTYSDVYLGVQIKNDKEITPRILVSPEMQGDNASRLQNLSIGTLAKSIPFINENNDVRFTEKDPLISSTDGIFTIQGQQLTLHTTQEQSGNIVLQPAIGANTLILNGKLGIGVLSPQQKVSVLGIEPYSSIMSVANISPEDIRTSSVLDLHLGAQINSINASFINFYAESTRDKSGTQVGRIHMGSGGVVYETKGADFAEYFTTSEKEAFQEHMIVGINTNGIVPAKMSDTIIGVVSSNPGFVGNSLSSQSEQSILVGLVGQVTVLVTNEYGDISISDPISVGSVPGFGVKHISHKKDTLGIALESSSVHNLSPEKCPYMYNNTKNIHGKPFACGLIRILLDIER